MKQLFVPHCCVFNTFVSIFFFNLRIRVLFITQCRIRKGVTMSEQTLTGCPVFCYSVYKSFGLRGVKGKGRKGVMLNADSRRQMYCREIGMMVRALDEIAGKEVERIVEGGSNRQRLWD